MAFRKKLAMTALNAKATRMLVKEENAYRVKKYI